MVCVAPNHNWFLWWPVRDTVFDPLLGLQVGEVCVFWEWGGDAVCLDNNETWPITYPTSQYHKAEYPFYQTQHGHCVMWCHMKLEWQVLSLKLHTLLFDTLQQPFSPRKQEEWKAGCTKNNCQTLIVIVKLIPASLGREYKSNQFFNLLYEENRKAKFHLASCFSKLCTCGHCMLLLSTWVTGQICPVCLFWAWHGLSP